jgi:hypothetical protein
MGLGEVPAPSGGDGSMDNNPQLLRTCTARRVAFHLLLTNLLSSGDH